MNRPIAFASKLYVIAFVVASASEAKPVIPTTVPLEAFSATVFAAALISETAVVSNSSMSLRLIVKTVSAVEPSALVARTVMVCETADSRSSNVPSATVTVPEFASIAKRPPALSNNAYVTVLLVASESDDEALIPTVVPLAAFSSTALVVASVSTGAVVSNSSRSLILIVKTVSAVEPSLEVARIVIFREAPSVSRLIAAAVVTTPVLASIAKFPLSLSNRL